MTACKLHKIWLDKGAEFYSRSMKSYVPNNNIEPYAAHKYNLSLVNKYNLLEPWKTIKILYIDEL